MSSDPHSSEPLLRQILRLIPGAYLSVIERDWTVGFTAGGEFVRRGLDPEAFVGQTVDAIFGRQAPRVRQHYERAFDGESVEFELHYEEQHQLYRAVPLPAEDGTIPRILAVAHDITERKESELALQEREALFRALFERHDAVMLLIEPRSGSIRDANRAASRFYGYDREALREMRIDQINLRPPASVADNRQQALAGEQNRFVFPHRLASGQVRTVEVHSSPIEIAGQTLLFSIVTDVTDRVRQGDELMQSDALFRKVFELLPVGLWIADRNGELKAGNPAGIRIWGGSPLVPQEDYGVFTARRLPSREEIAPEDWALAHTVNEGVTITDELLEIDAFDGVRRTILNSTAPVLDDQGEVTAAIVVNHDISALQAAERDLRLSEDRARSYIDNAPIGVFIVNETGRYVEVNPAASVITGYSREELLSMNLADFYPDDTKPDAGARFAALQQSGHVTAEAEFRHKDGSLRSWTLDAVKLSDRRFLAFATDNTARKAAETDKRRLERELHRAQRMESIGRLAGGVAHDFNNLLTVITANLAFLEEPAPGESTTKVLEEMRQATTRATDLTRQLLAFGRRQVMEPKVIRFETLRESLEPMLRRLIGEHIALRWERAAEVGPVQVDIGQLEQVLVNLALNARDAMPEGGTLTFQAREQPWSDELAKLHASAKARPYVRIDVRDTGHGMSPEVANQIFEPFFTTKAPDQGTGLGLATAFGIVDQLGGFFEVDSVEGRGTTISVFLPRVKDEPAPVDNLRPPRPPTRSPRGSETVLVVEDEESVRNVARRILERAGYTVHTADSAEAALALFEDTDLTIDLLLTDIIMPGLNGHQLAQRLEHQLGDLRVLYTSGYSEDIIARQGVIVPGLKLLRKPYAPAELREAVRGLLDK